MSDARAQVRNAADPRQVARAARVERRRDETFRAALQVVMQSAEGRFVMWALLSRAGVYGSIWDASARIHYNAGRQDFGHELLADLTATDEMLYLQMETEMRAWQKREDRETDAAHTSRAEQGDAR